MKLARLDDNGQIIEIMPHNNFHPDLLAKCVNVPDNAGVGFYFKGGQVIDPPPGRDFILNAGNVWVENPAAIKLRQRKQAKADFLATDLAPVTTIAGLKAVLANLQVALGKE